VVGVENPFLTASTNHPLGYPVFILHFEEKEINKLKLTSKFKKNTVLADKHQK